jgi:hypothetical protein
MLFVFMQDGKEHKMLLRQKVIEQLCVFLYPEGLI